MVLSGLLDVAVIGCIQMLVYFFNPLTLPGTVKYFELLNYLY